MSDRLGKVALSSEASPYLGGSMIGNYGPRTARLIDEEVSALIEKQYQRVLELMRTYLDRTHNIVSVLIEHETLSGEEFATVLAGGTLSSVSLGKA